MKIVIEGQCPSKKNSRNLFVRNGRIVNIPSKIHAAWERQALVSLQTQYRGQFDGPVSVTCEFYNKDKRLRDIDNQQSAVLDLLVKSGLLKDDNYLNVVELHGYFKGIDKENPRVQIKVSEVNDIMLS